LYTEQDPVEEEQPMYVGERAPGNNEGNMMVIMQPFVEPKICLAPCIECSGHAHLYYSLFAKTTMKNNEKRAKKKGQSQGKQKQKQEPKQEPKKNKFCKIN
tara:strand:+ start:313 stop:615 length:303 start_codon:yes stop_codon:yes gene_type:complete